MWTYVDGREENLSTRFRMKVIIDQVLRPQIF